MLSFVFLSDIGSHCIIQAGSLGLPASTSLMLGSQASLIMTGMLGPQVSSTMTDSKHLAFKMEWAGDEREKNEERRLPKKKKKKNLRAPVCAPACMCAYHTKCQKRVSDPMELELQKIVRCLMWGLETELGSSARAARALNHLFSPKDWLSRSLIVKGWGEGVASPGRLDLGLV